MNKNNIIKPLVALNNFLSSIALMMIPVMIMVAVVYVSIWAILPILGYKMFQLYQERNIPKDPELGVKVILASGWAEKLTGGYYAEPGRIYVPKAEYNRNSSIVHHELFHAKDWTTYLLIVLAYVVAYLIATLNPFMVIGLLVYAMASRIVENRADEYSFQHAKEFKVGIDYFVEVRNNLDKMMKAVTIGPVAAIVLSVDKAFALHPPLNERILKLIEADKKSESYTDKAVRAALGDTPFA